MYKYNMLIKSHFLYKIGYMSKNDNYYHNKACIFTPVMIY